MGPIGPPTSPKHADRPRLLQSSVFYTHGCCYSGRSLFYMEQGNPGKPGLSVWPTKYCFRTFGAKVLEIFVLMIRQCHRNESSWNVCSRGTNVPRNESYWNLCSRGDESSTGAKVPRSECSMERKFHGSESSLYGLFAPGNESAEERKGLESKVRKYFCNLFTTQLPTAHYKSVVLRLSGKLQNLFLIKDHVVIVLCYSLPAYTHMHSRQTCNI